MSPRRTAAHPGVLCINVLERCPLFYKRPRKYFVRKYVVQKYFRTFVRVVHVRDGFRESMNKPRFKICRADETSVLPVSTHNLPFNSLSKLFSPANRWSRRQKHARDARFGTQKKIRCRCAVRGRCLLSPVCPCGNFLFNLNRRVCVFRARRECGNILQDLQV